MSDMMRRSIPREVAMKIVYSELLGGQDTPEAVIEKSEIEKPLSKAEQAFAEELVAGVVEYADQLDVIISDHAIGWTLDRIAKVDRAILRVALYEMLYREDVPTAAAINEAIELAKRFGGDKSYSFVNGVLGAAAKQFEAEAKAAEAEA